MAKHSAIGASGAHRWMECPGSVRMSSGLPSTSSIYADEGTAAHALLEKCLNGEQRPIKVADYLGQTIEGFEVTQEMVDAVQMHVDDMYQRWKPYFWLKTEVRFDLSHLHPGLYGTSDIVMYDPRTFTLYVDDFKYGAGKPVEVKDNPQLKYYALGAAHANPDWKIEKVVLTVVQPRCDHPQGPIRDWPTTPMELLDWSFDLIEKAKATEAPDAPLCTGDHCKWCPAAGICPALQNQAQELAKFEFSPVMPYDPEELARALDLVPLAKQWIKAVEDFAQAEAKQGRVPPNRKLVQTQGHRKWSDPKAAAEAAFMFGLDEKDTHEPPELKSPTQLEKMVGKEDFNELFGGLVSRGQGVALATLDDKRPSVRADIKGEFSVVE